MRWRARSSRRARRTAPPTSTPGRTINLEFVSANPTGPVHIGGARWAPVGDSLARVFATLGADVAREYYFNDHGAQIDRFARSLLAVARGQDAPEDGYVGEYVAEIAAQGGRVKPRRALDCPTSEAQEIFRRDGVDLMFTRIKQTLHGFGVDFDVYFHEQSLHDSGAVERAIAAADRDGQHLRGRRRAVAAHRAVRRRQGPGAGQVRRRTRPTSRVTAPTTSTSASAASTCA